MLSLGEGSHTSKFLLLCFQEISGLAINFGKSEVMVLGYPEEERHRIANLLNCRLGTFPTSYLVIPISDARIQIKDLRPIVARMQHRVEPWQGRLLSKAARAIIINSSLSSLVMYVMGFYSLPETLHP